MREQSKQSVDVDVTRQMAWIWLAAVVSLVLIGIYYIAA